MAVTFHLKDFDGPLDLLLFLVGKAQIDIRDIFVSEVTDQYIQSVSMADDLDMDDASAFITMAATLIEIKSRSLLPKPPQEEEGEDPEKLLIMQLEMYKRMKEIANDLRAFEKTAAALFTKLPEEYPLPPQTYELTGLTQEGLFEAMRNVLRRLRYREDIANNPVSNRILRDRFDVPGCMKSIRSRLRRGKASFSALFSEHPSRTEVVTVFLAVLELIRLGRITVVQNSIHDDMILLPVPAGREAVSDTEKDVPAGYENEH